MHSRETIHREALIEDFALAIKEVARKIDSGFISTEDLSNALEEVLQPSTTTKNSIEVEEQPGIVMSKNSIPAIDQAFFELEKAIMAKNDEKMKVVTQAQYKEHLRFIGSIKDAVTSGRLDANFFRDIKSLN